MAQIGSTNVSVSQIQALRGIGGQQSLKAAELSLLGDSGNVARPEVSNVCMPNELRDDSSATLGGVDGAWTYTGPANAGGDWGQTRVSEFFAAYNGVPYINVVGVRTGGTPTDGHGGATSEGRWDYNFGGEFNGVQPYYVAKGAGGGWVYFAPGVNSNSETTYPTTIDWYVKDYLNCGSNKGGTTNIFVRTASYP